jgi:flagellum-specific peptidoglycan hydrolase FlgJ
VNLGRTNRSASTTYSLRLISASMPRTVRCRARAAAGAHAAAARVTRQQLQFLFQVTPPALESEREFEIPACITVAQAILESATPRYGWGSSRLFRLANNPFGIKSSHQAIGPSDHRAIGPSEAQEASNSSEGSVPSPQPQVPGPDPYGHFDAATWEVENGHRKEIVAQFRRFPNLTEAFRAHSRLLLSPRYRPAYEARRDWKQFAERLGPKQSAHDADHCGYSTNPSYSAQLIKLVETYRLNDRRAIEWLASGKDPGPVLQELLQ